MNSPRLTLDGQMEMAPLAGGQWRHFNSESCAVGDLKSYAALGSYPCGSMTYLFATPASKDL